MAILSRSTLSVSRRCGLPSAGSALGWGRRTADGPSGVLPLRSGFPWGGVTACWPARPDELLAGYVGREHRSAYQRPRRITIGEEQRIRVLDFSPPEPNAKRDGQKKVDHDDQGVEGSDAKCAHRWYAGQNASSLPPRAGASRLAVRRRNSRNSHIGYFACLAGGRGDERALPLSYFATGANASTGIQRSPTFSCHCRRVAAKRLMIGAWIGRPARSCNSRGSRARSKS